MFNSLGRSVLMYCSPVWGIGECERLETFQMNFVKRVLGLSKYCPRWFARLETRTKSIKMHLLSSTVKFLIRVIQSPVDSLTKQALLDLIQLHRKPGTETTINWFSQVVKMCEDFKVTDILNISEIDKMTVTDIRSKLRRALSFVDNKEVEQDIAFMQSNSNFSQYGQIKTHAKCEQYLNEDVPWFVSSLWCQLRLNFNYIRVKNMKTKLFSCKFSKKDEQCVLCGNGKEDVHHLMCVCPHYKSVRNSTYFDTGIDLRNVKSENFVGIFKFESKEIMSKIYYLLSQCMKIRELYLEEMNENLKN